MFLQKLVYLFLMLMSISLVVSCGGNDKPTDSEKTEKKERKRRRPAAEESTAPAIDPMTDVGVGPVTELVLPAEIDADMAAKGDEIFKAKCAVCHKTTEKYIGPAPKGVFERRNPAWVMNMILNPTKMVQENEAAKALLAEFNGSPMANQNLTEEEARSVVEYFRTIE